jgi:exopolysaccharide production protein ExoZ
MIKPIQYLRGIAALSVVWLHALTMMPGFTERLGQPVFRGGGVDLFFVISGFIMWVTTQKPATPLQFIRLRLVRVVPLYWLATLCLVAFAVLGLFKTLQFSTRTVIESLLFIPYGADPVLAPGWTLNYEMFFYGVFALSLFLPKPIRLASLAAALIGLATLGLHADGTSPVAVVYTSPLLLEFLAGSVIAFLWLGKTLEIGLPVSALMIGAGTMLLFGWSNLLGASLVVAGCLNQRIRGWNIRPLLALGDASYSIYLTHLFGLAALKVFWLRWVPFSSGSALAFMALALASSSAVGWLCYRFIETPMTQWLRLNQPRFIPRLA